MVPGLAAPTAPRPTNLLRPVTDLSPKTMAERLTRNVSLPAHQNSFVEAMVAGGRYRTASEVVREGLRLLEEAEHRRLLEAWLLEELRGDDLKWEGLVAEGGAGLPEGLVERARAQVRAVLGLADVGLAEVGGKVEVGLGQAS